jgi:hypothetical protein
VRNDGNVVALDDRLDASRPERRGMEAEAFERDSSGNLSDKDKLLRALDLPIVVHAPSGLG